MRQRNKVLILSVLLLVVGFFLLKNPVTEYIEIKNGNNEQLSKKFIKLKYSYLWDEQSFGLVGDSSTNEHTVITLKKDKLRVLNHPFSTSDIIFFELLYNENEPSISVSFNLTNIDTTYYYQKDSVSDLKYFSINDTAGKAFIEKTSRLSISKIKKDIETNQANFLNGLNFVKEKKLNELQSDIKFRLIFFFVITIISIVLLTLFLCIKI
ncbi:hypothetical protein ACWOC1_06150 [Enterococcus quebecensis]|uniref:Uncharacterized protein n=1 Tax=Enterococcus quebecensis TaxID=903983 RepID=A0A1E5GXH3_9ENTE|nr:hypothetical protein [Enterococcus quebecensis]OEG17295.1 hypothetical protein BCR23_04640 [Enterococcus quebecensis]